MSDAVESLLARVSVEARRDPVRVRPVLQVLVGDEPDHEGGLREVASQLNEARRDSLLAEFRAGSLTADAVRQLLGLGSRQAVHQLRQRGRLLGRTLGNTTLFPAWQFAGGALRPDLPALLQALCRFSTDAVAADRIMRLPRPELDGRSLAEAIDKPNSADVVRVLLDRLGGGF
ncbi:MAG: hypothetical protein ACRDZ7_20495 [Acidimicrobiia bacterium]